MNGRVHVLKAHTPPGVLPQKARPWRLTPLQEFNPNHAPAGTAAGGQFSTSQGGTSAAKTGGATGGGRAGVSAASRPEANATVQAESTRYAQAHGLAPVTHGYIEVDQTRAGQIADLYDSLPLNDSANPAVKRAYEALGREVQAQWDFAISQGATFEPWTKDGQPYATSAEMAEDVRTHRHLAFYTGGDAHPFLGAKDAAGLSLNDKFRAIHDYYGHAAGGYGFGPRGEENAWAAHSQMFSPEARRAMTTETRGQSSWVNFGRQNYNADGSSKNIPAAQRPFAVQKVALLPDEFVFGKAS